MSTGASKTEVVTKPKNLWNEFRKEYKGKLTPLEMSEKFLELKQDPSSKYYNPELTKKTSKSVRTVGNKPITGKKRSKKEVYGTKDKPDKTSGTVGLSEMSDQQKRDLGKYILLLKNRKKYKKREFNKLKDEYEESIGAVYYFGDDKIQESITKLESALNPMVGVSTSKEELTTSSSESEYESPAPSSYEMSEYMVNKSKIADLTKELKKSISSTMVETISTLKPVLKEEEILPATSSQPIIVLGQDVEEEKSPEREPDYVKTLAKEGGRVISPKEPVFFETKSSYSELADVSSVGTSRSTLSEYEVPYESVAGERIRAEKAEISTLASLTSAGPPLVETPSLSSSLESGAVPSGIETGTGPSAGSVGSESSLVSTGIGAMTPLSEPPVSIGPEPSETTSGPIEGQPTQTQESPIPYATTATKIDWKVVHKIPILLFFGSTTKPDWDTELEKTIDEITITKEEINTIIDGIIAVNGDKIMVSSRLKDGDINEFKEIIELHFCLERNLAKGSRYAKASVPLSQLVSLASKVSPSTTTTTTTPSVTGEISSEPVGAGGLDADFPVGRVDETGKELSEFIPPESGGPVEASTTSAGSVSFETGQIQIEGQGIFVPKHNSNIDKYGDKIMDKNLVSQIKIYQEQQGQVIAFGVRKDDYVSQNGKESGNTTYTKFIRIDDC